MTNTSVTVGIGITAEGAREAAQDISAVDASVRKMEASFGTLARHDTTAGVEKIRTLMRGTGVEINASSRHVQALAIAIQAVAREKAFHQLAQDANLSAVQVARLRAGMGDMAGAFSTLGSAARGATVGIAAFAAGALYMSKVCLDAMLELDRLEKAYATIGGSTQAGTVQLAHIAEVSQTLGLQFQQTAASAKTFFAAVHGTTLESDANRIFAAVSKGASALSLSGDEVQRVFLALGQMVSKGKIQAEELRGQLGEALPGAFQMAARAMGMTTAELDKFMADGKLTAEELLPRLADVMEGRFAKGAEEASEGIQAAVNRMTTAWEQFKASILDSDAVIGTLNMMSAALNQVHAIEKARREDASLEARMKKAGWEPDADLDDGEYNFFQKELFLEMEADADRRRRRVEQDALYQEKLYSDMRQAITDSLKGTADYEMQQLQRTKAERLAAIDAGIAAMERAGEKESILAAARMDRIRVETALNEKLKNAAEKGRKRGASPEERFAKRSEQYQTGIEQLRKEVAILEMSVDPALTGVEKLEAKLRAERDMAFATAEAHRMLALQRGQATPAQAAEVESLEKRKAEAIYQQKLNELQGSNLQERAAFYKELAAKTGEYSLSLEYQNQLLDKQVQIWTAMGIPLADVARMQELLRLELSTNPWDGMERAFRKYAASVQDGGAQMEQLFSGMFDAISSAGTQAFTELFTTGTLEVDKFFANLFAQLAQLAAQQAAKALVGGILGAIGGALAGSIGGMTWFGSGHTGAVIGSAGATPRAVSPLAFADAPRYHNGGMLGLRPDEVPFIGLRGERVLNPAETYAYNAGMARAGGDGGQMAEMVGLLRQLVAGQTTGAASGGTSVVLVDDQRKVKDYLLSNDGQKTFVAMLNQNRQAIQNVANGGRA